MALPSLTSTLVLVAGTYLYLTPQVQAVTTYANVFFNPDFLAAGSFNQSTALAQKTIVQWADQLASQGPWSVTSKAMSPPSGDKHDYMSFSPYAWPDCSNAGNTTVMSPEEIWTTCEYVTRDGQFNPDARSVNDIGNFDDMADAVLYNTFAWVISGSTTYSSNAARFIQTWFLNQDSAMNPNLNFAQMKRGVDGQKGTHTGILDLKCMSKVVNGVLTLRDRKAAEWTSGLDGQMVGWTKQYLSWLQTAPTAMEEATATNNHGSFYYNQLAALQLLTGNKSAAQKSIQTYFQTLFAGQIAANGDQPLESNRTRPYHYRAYNLAAMITNARLGEYAGYKAWEDKTASGATIQSALDFAITQAPGDDDPTELYPHVAAVGVQYGDADGKYGKFLASHMDDAFIKAPFYLWDDLFVVGLATPTSTQSPTHAPTSGTTGSASSASESNSSSHKGGYKPQASGSLSNYILSSSCLVANSVIILAVTFALNI